jgi:hypothetical protein
MSDLPADLPKQKALLALGTLSQALRSDVLGNRKVAEQFGISLSNPITLDGVVVERKVLFRAFAQVADNVPVEPLVDEDGNELQAVVSLDPDGAGIVTIAKKRWRFEDSVFLSGQVVVRAAALERRLATCSLAMRQREVLRALVRDPAYETRHFFELIKVLTSAPEYFVRGLRERLGTEKIGKGDLLPDNVLHWDHLVPPPEQSSTLDAYVADELALEWKQRLAEHPGSTLANITLTCAAPALVPRALLAALPTDLAERFAREQAGHDDPFGLICALQLCADRVAGEPVFGPLGKELLERLFSVPARLTTACQVFAAAFIVATAHLAEHKVLGRRPAFWRRLAAASHASLVVRGCGITEATQDGLIPWAVHVAGDAYVLSVFAEFIEMPRWRPDWIADDFVFADVFGRALSAVKGVEGDKAPPSWQARLDAVKAAKDDTPMVVLASFPAVLEGARRAELPDLPADGPVAEFFRPLMEDPSVDHLMMMSSLIYTFGCPAAALDSVLTVAAALRAGPWSLDDTKTRRTLEVLAHIAVESMNEKLADAVAETCLEKIGAATETHAAVEAALRLVECSAASGDRTNAETLLVQRLERLAVENPTADMCTELVALLTHLKSVQPQLEPRLGRALAWATLGTTRRAA